MSELRNYPIEPRNDVIENRNRIYDGHFQYVGRDESYPQLNDALERNRGQEDLFDESDKMTSRRQDDVFDDTDKMTSRSDSRLTAERDNDFVDDKNVAKNELKNGADYEGASSLILDGHFGYGGFRRRDESSVPFRNESSGFHDDGLPVQTEESLYCKYYQDKYAPNYQKYSSTPPDVMNSEETDYALSRNSYLQNVFGSTNCYAADVPTDNGATNLYKRKFENLPNKCSDNYATSKFPNYYYAYKRPDLTPALLPYQTPYSENPEVCGQFPDPGQISEKFWQWYQNRRENNCFSGNSSYPLTYYNTYRNVTNTDTLNRYSNSFAFNKYANNYKTNGANVYTHSSKSFGGIPDDDRSPCSNFIQSPNSGVSKGSGENRSAPETSHFGCAPHRETLSPIATDARLFATEKDEALNKNRNPLEGELVQLGLSVKKEAKKKKVPTATLR